jgi:hypothetical protein
MTSDQVLALMRRHFAGDDGRAWNKALELFGMWGNPRPRRERGAEHLQDRAECSASCRRKPEGCIMAINRIGTVGTSLDWSQLVEATQAVESR